MANCGTYGLEGIICALTAPYVLLLAGFSPGIAGKPEHITQDS